MNAEVKIFNNEEQLFNNAAKEITELINFFISKNNKCTWVLSGGSTPNKLYEIICNNYNDKVNWEKVFIFWGDERCVPPENDESNYKSAKIHLLDKLPIPQQNIFRIPGELLPIEAAEIYESELKDFFPGDGLPSLDILLLGIGKDGHTASLFPEGKALLENNKWVTADFINKLNTWRVTITLPVINNSKNIIFIASGSDKASIVNRVLNDKNASLPAQKVNPLIGKLYWFLEKNAAKV